MNQFSEVEQVGCWPAGAVLFREGDAPTGIFVIHSGAVDLIFSARNGTEKPLRNLRAGEIAGLSDAVSGTAHDCTARTRSASRISFVPIAELKRLLDERPGMWLGVAEILSSDLDACWDSMRGLAAAR